MRKQSIVLASIAGLLMSSLALAQKPVRPPPPARPPGRGAPPPAPPNGPAMREKVLERLRMMRMWKLTEVLSLDEATGAKLFPLLKQFDDRSAPIVEELRIVRQDLAKAMAPGQTMDAATANTLVERLLAGRKKMQDLESDRIAAVRKVLSPIQQAKMVLVLPQINRMLEQAVRKAVRAGRAGAGGGPGGPGAKMGKGGGDSSGADDDDIN